MSKVTLTIAHDAPSEAWDELYRRIEEHAAAADAEEVELARVPTEAEVKRNRRLFWETEMGGVSD